MSQGKHSEGSLAELLTGYWDVVTKKTGLPLEAIARSALIAPARCCLIDIGFVETACPAEPGGRHGAGNEERPVERAFGYVKAVSAALRERFRL